MSFLKEIKFNWEESINVNSYPFNIPSLRSVDSIDTEYNVVFFLGENGSGKSTLLEALASKCGFATVGGSRNQILSDNRGNFELSKIMKLSWFPKINNGFFLRAESFFNFANYLDNLAEDKYNSSEEVYMSYGGKSLHHQSHGESFISLFNNRFKRKGIYILDEPEAALSPQSQLGFLRMIWELESRGVAQFIIATHSPILLSYPKSRIYSMNGGIVEKINYKDTEHYNLTKDFLNNPEMFLSKILR
ncbi:AAA family ATPase [Wukongibacter sp. M2B1]|uniref:AAA family ATPase n=1 Tax=Wukongibacter sp. M2B1 TaxID=3088895 RepID=UPI003D78DEA3